MENLKLQIKFILLNKTVEVSSEQEVTETIRKEYPNAVFDPSISDNQRTWFAYKDMGSSSPPNPFTFMVPTIVAIITRYK